MIKTLPKGRRHPCPLIHRRGNDQLVHQVGMTDSDLQCRSTTVAETKYIGLVDMQLLQKSGHVVGVLLKRNPPSIPVVTVPMPLKFDGNDLMCPGQGRQQ